MRVLCLVNDAAEIVATQTTAMLLHAAARRGHEVWATGVSDLSLEPDDRILARARRARRAPAPAPAPTAVSMPTAKDDPGRAALALRAWVESLCAAPPEPLDTAGLDLLLMRTNPGRDAARARLHEAALGFARLLEARGLRVANAPEGLARAASKLYLAQLPRETRPAARVSSDPGALAARVRDGERPRVLKPLAGSRGRGVFRVDGADPNLGAMAELLADGDYAMAQDLVEAEEPGDLRLLLLDGRPLTRDGRLAAIRRLPADGAFRANLHAGGRAAPAELTPGLRRLAGLVGPRLRADGIRLAGLDVVGTRIIELNVFSPGGLRDAERFTGLDFSAAVMEALETDPAPEDGEEDA